MIFRARVSKRTWGLLTLAVLFLAACESSRPGPHPNSPLTQVRKITSNDSQDWDKFGWSVDLDGSQLIVGTNIVQSPYFPEGKAYLFSRNSGGAEAWGEAKAFTASDGLDMDLFGYSVSVDGDTALVGASWEDSDGIDTGAAHLFDRDEGGAGAWGELKRLVASDGPLSYRFGNAVSLDGDIALVGAPGSSVAASYSGAVYVFGRDQGGPNNWGEAARILPSDPQEAAWFGFSVALDGDLAVIGAITDDGPGIRCGAAYVFYRNGGAPGTWQEIKKLTASDAADQDEFGISVAASGDLVIVGADWKHEAGVAVGAAYVFGRNQGGLDNWGLIKKLSAADAASGDAFGISVSISNECALVGAPGADGAVGTVPVLGAVYVFRRNLGGADAWGVVGKVIPSDAGESAQFGQSTSLAGDLFAVGAPVKPGGGTYRGAVYVFRIKT